MRWVGCVILFCLSGLVFAQKPAIDPLQYVIKFKPNVEISNQLVREEISAKSILPQALSVVNHEAKHSVLNNIYSVTVKKGTDIQALCDSLNRLDHVVYAEPIYLESLLERPNDPGAQTGNQQKYLDVIKAIEAWGLTKSDANIKIAIIDSGIQLDHEDLRSKLYENDDPVNGLDDDGNGYIDDRFGYDFADRDPDATADLNQHGTHVAGIAGAATNNEKGIAGVGYNVSITPLKIFRSSDGLSANSYEAILYAADNGYDIATLSWGSINTYSQFNQDIITYAAKEKNVILIGAAGNTNSEVFFYPASYDYVLSVGATNNEDRKASFSTFNNKIDISAPGQAIYSTQNNDTYGFDNGTSHAVPQVAGVAALVKHQYPALSAIQIMERIRVTADDIYGIPDNQAFLGKLGRGRLNAYRAVDENNLISIRPTEFNISNSNPYFGDTIQITAQFTNYLDPAINPTIHLNTSSPYLTFDQTQFSIGYIPTLDSFSISEIMGFVSENTPPSSDIYFTLTITEKKFSETHHYKITTAPDYVTLEKNEFSFEIGGNGNLGNENPVIFLDNMPILVQSGIMIANEYNQIADNVISNWETGSRDQDFKTLQPIRKFPNAIAIDYANSKFQTTDASSFAHLIIDQEVFGFDSLRSTVVKLHIINGSTDTLFQTHLGVLSNWNIGEFLKNKAFWDSNNTAFTSDSAGTAFGAIRVLGGLSSNFSAIENDQFESTVGILNDSSKWILITNSEIDSLGFDQPIDVITTISARLDTLKPKESSTVYVLFAAGYGYEDILNTLNETENRIGLIQANPYIIETILSCEGGQVIVNPEVGEKFIFFSDPYGLDTLGSGEFVTINLDTTEKLVFVSNTDSGYSDAIRSIRISASDQIADFSMSVDTLFLGDLLNNRISFRDKSLLPVNWTWDFGNGQQASGIQNPSSIFSQVGVYTIKLTVQNGQGCNATISKNLVVMARPDLPAIENLLLCPGAEIIFNQTGDHLLRVYLDATNTGIVAEGDSINIGMVTKDTSFHLVQVVNGIESKRKLITIQLLELDSSFAITPVLDSLIGNYVLVEINDKNISEIQWKIDDDIISDSLSFLWNVEKESYSLEANYRTKDGCAVQFSDSLNFTPAPQPTLITPQFCLGDTARITPMNGKYFGLYLDENLMNPIAKGNNFKLAGIEKDSIFYLAGLDGVLPSIGLAIHLSPIDFRFKIQSEPDSLPFPNQQSAIFSIDKPAVNYRWFINDRLESNVPSPTFYFADTGQYKLSVRAISEFNCIHHDTLIFKVYPYFEPVLGISATQLVIYPNPATNELNIQSSEAILNINLFSLDGKLLLSETKKVLDISKIKSGIYLLKVKFENGEIIVTKIIKK